MITAHLATFRVDATPPMGHPLCGGWIKPVGAVDDRLWLRGVVITDAGPPIVLAALDWTGVMNESHRSWTEALAEAANTSPDRVALHCVHQHNAPFIDREGNALLRKAGADPLLYVEKFVDELVARSADAVRRALIDPQPITHVRAGSAKVEQVACNRRVIGPDGKIKFTRYSATRDEAARAEPDGTIDPILRSVGLFQGDRPLARLYYYTTHPMSYYGDGRVTSDFVGLARDRRDAEEPGALHVYFTGSAGNVTAGKYNTGTQPDRAALVDRVHRAMAGADLDADRHASPLGSMAWKVLPIRFAAREDLDLDRLKAIVADPKRTTTERNRSAMTCGWLIRAATRRPILLSSLDLGAVTLLHLPAETFVEYQLDAQATRPNLQIATAAYGDGGPWYIPLTRSFDEGGYEPSVANVSPRTEPAYRQAIRDLLIEDRPGVGRPAL
jgi:hypothetical protein